MEPLIWAIILLAIGLMLIVVELFVPSGGVIGVLSAAAILGAIGVGFSGGPKTGVAVLVATMIIVPALIGFAVKTWPDTPLGRLVLIQLPEDQDEVLPDASYLRELKQLVGRTGRVKSPMLPSGLVVVDGRTFDASTPGMSLDVGQMVQVISVNMNRLVVRPCDEVKRPIPLPEPAAVDPLAQPIDQLGIEPLDDPLA